MRYIALHSYAVLQHELLACRAVLNGICAAVLVSATTFLNFSPVPGAWAGYADLSIILRLIGSNELCRLLSGGATSQGKTEVS
jgi:hypothetical protein